MADVDTHAVGEAVHKIISDASAEDTLDELTPRIIRQKVVEMLGLEEGALDAKGYRELVKDKVADAMEALEADSDDGEKKKKETKVKAKPEKPSKRKSEAESVSPPAKKAKATPKREMNKSEGKSASSKKAKNGKAIRSPSVVPSSDEEDDEPNEKPASSKAPISKLKRPALIKNQSENDADVSTTDVRPVKKGKQTHVDDSDEEESKDVKTSASPPKGKKPKSKLAQTVVADEDVEMDEGPSADTPKDDAADQTQKSESEMSVLIDEPPKRGRKKKTKTEEKPTKTKRKSKAAADEDPVDAEIKRLKGFVTGCGVRKVWSKEFRDCTDDRQAQIRRIKQILSDLGMKGRLSMDKAHKIKAERELKKELEDVKDFYDAMVKKPRKKSASPPSEVEEDGNESDNDDLPPKRPIRNARTSIMAFLDDQSDSE